MELVEGSDVSGAVVVGWIALWVWVLQGLK